MKYFLFAALSSLLILAVSGRLDAQSSPEGADTWVSYTSEEEILGRQRWQKDSLRGSFLFEAGAVQEDWRLKSFALEGALGGGGAALTQGPLTYLFNPLERTSFSPAWEEVPRLRGDFSRTAGSSRWLWVNFSQAPAVLGWWEESRGAGFLGEIPLGSSLFLGGALRGNPVMGQSVPVGEVVWWSPESNQSWREDVSYPQGAGELYHTALYGRWRNEGALKAAGGVTVSGGSLRLPGTAGFFNVSYRRSGFWGQIGASLRDNRFRTDRGNADSPRARGGLRLEQGFILFPRRGIPRCYQWRLRAGGDAEGLWNNPGELPVLEGLFRLSLDKGNAGWWETLALKGELEGCRDEEGGQSLSWDGQLANHWRLGEPFQLVLLLNLQGESQWEEAGIELKGSLKNGQLSLKTAFEPDNGYPQPREITLQLTAEPLYHWEAAASYTQEIIPERPAFTGIPAENGTWEISISRRYTEF